MDKVLEQIMRMGIVPVLKIDDVKKAAPVAKAMAAGGISCVEVTFRTPHGEEAIRRIASEVPGLLLGAGTVLTTGQVDQAVSAGARFIVSPGLNPKVVEYCLEKNITVIPGCTTPSDIEQALALGLSAVKFFPAEQAGGLDYLKAVAAPYPSLKFVANGGITAANITKYLAFDNVLACCGTWMVAPELIASGDFAEITRLCREAVMTIMGFELAHVGINCENEDEAGKSAKMFELMFGFAPKDDTASIFSGGYIESMKSPYLGKYGHIAIATTSPARARAFLEQQGFSFNEKSAKYLPDGTLRSAYLNEEIAGFAIHLLKKNL